MEIRDFINEIEEDYLRDTIRHLSNIGEVAYRKAMEGRTFKDDTGALASSIGWAIVHNGEIVRKGGFQSINGNTQGISEGIQMIHDVMGQQPMELIFVAGMKYATYVEARGYDVNTAGELIIEELLTR